MRLAIWFCLGFFLQTHNPSFVDANCECVNINIGYTYSPDICCYLGSSKCDSQAVCVKDGEMCPRRLRPSTVGHFIAGSISWREIGENSVEFEIMSTWRLSFHWPYQAPVSTYTGPCGYPGIGDRVPIVGISSSSTGNSSYTAAAPNPLQIMDGPAFLQLESGLKPI
jgi:hypothetical protein